FLNLSFHASRRAVQRIRTEGVGKTIWEVAADLLASLEAHELGNQLAVVNRGLVPGFNPRLSDSKAQTRYPRLAQQSLEDAAWLREQERRYGLLTPLFDALSASLQQGSLDPELQSLEQSVKRSKAASSLIKDLAGLETFLRQEALEKPQDEVLAGKS